MSSAREAGYRLFGRRFDYLLHLRPAEWPIMAAHTAVGYFLAVGLAGAASGLRLVEWFTDPDEMFALSLARPA